MGYKESWVVILLPLILIVWGKSLINNPQPKSGTSQQSKSRLLITLLKGMAVDL